MAEPIPVTAPDVAPTPQAAARAAASAAPSAAASTPAPAARPPLGVRLLRHTGWAVALLVALLLVSAAVLVGLPFTGAGSAWLLERLTAFGVTVEAPQGRLLGGDFAVARLRYALTPTRTLQFERVDWHGLHWQRDAAGRPRLVIARLHIGRIDLVGPGDGLPVHLPSQLVLPLAIDVEQLQVDEAAMDAIRDQPLRALSARAHLGAGAGATHTLSGVQGQWDRLQASSGEAELGAAAPLNLKATLTLAGVEPPAATSATRATSATTPQDNASTPPATRLPPWQMQLQASGPLATLAVQAELRARGQSLQAQATVRPAAPMPLTRLQAEVSALDLAAFASALPTTAISGQVDLVLDAESAGRAAEPLHAQARLRNDAAGNWAAQRLPLRTLALQASGDLRTPDHGRVAQLDLQLGSDAEPAGTVKANGQWAWIGTGADRRIELELDAQVAELQPQRLHPASPPLSIGGPLAWRWRQPWPQTDGAGPAAPSTGPASRAATAAAPAGFETSVRTRLTGRLLGSGLPAVTLALDAQADPSHLTVRELHAESGAARLTAQAKFGRSAGVLSASGSATLRGFDPLPWWPHRPSVQSSDAVERLLAHGDHALNGQLSVDVHAPATLSGPYTDPGRLTALLSAVRGSAALDLQPSRLAGVALQGRWTLGAEAASGHTALQLAIGPAEAPTTLSLEGTLDGRLGAAASADHWQGSWASADLARLEPWLSVGRGAGAATRATADAPLQGRTEGQFQLDGRWPHLVSRGELRADELSWREAPDNASVRAAGNASPAAPLARLKGLSARWRIGTEADDPLELTAALAQLDSAGWRARGLTVTSSGSNAAHHLQASLVRGERMAPAPSSPSSPSSTSSTSSASSASSAPSASSASAAWAVAFSLGADGGWQHDAALGQLGWRGRLAQLMLAEAAEPSAAAAVSAPSAGAPATAAAPAATSALLTSEPTGPNANGNVSLAQLIRPLRLLVDGADVQWTQGRGRSSLRIGPTRAHLGDLHLALQGLSWQNGAEDLSNAQTASAAGSAAPLAGQRLSLKAQLESVEVAPWMQRAQPGFGWGGDLRINGRVDAQISPERVDLDLLLQRERGDLQITDPDNPRNPQRLGLADLRLGLSAHDGRWRLTQTLSGGNLGRLDGEQNLVAPPQALRPPPQSPVSGQIDLKVAQLGNWGRWLPAGWRLSGQLASSARLAGTVGAPEFSGELRGSNLAVRNLLQGVDWRDAEVNLQLEGARARIETLRIRAGEGMVSATGQIELGAAPRADLKLHADHFAALQRVDRRIVASGDAELQLDERSTTLKGSLRADEGRIDFSQSDSPSLSDDVSVKRPEDAAQARERAAAARGQRSTSIDVRADLGPSFTVKGRGLQSRLAGELRFSNPGNKLAVSGLIRAVDGNFASYGQKLRIDRGLLSFNGPVDNPRLDIEATRSDIEDVRVGVTVTGTAQAPRVRLFSVPTMTDTDRLSWLLLGRAPDGLGRTDLALLQRSAYSLLAGESDAPSLIERVGLDQLSVRQNDVGDTRETIVSLGKQLSRRWYVGYERGLNAAAGTWQLIYRAAERFTLRAQSGTENALDLIWTWKWGQGDELLTPITGPRPVAAPAPGAAASSARP